mmetsp:Transcript_19000/g.21166  ORF Transcript_19000/g.21166 Transcript_19000/m.21166 type:complete len:169 (+) Transcript_19000:23-529(+)
MKRIIYAGIFLIAIVAALNLQDTAPAACADCHSCPKAATCIPSHCSVCSSLASGFATNGSLIMQINMTSSSNHGAGDAYMANVLKIYQGHGSGIVVATIPQQATDPCLTEFFLAEPYLVVIPHESSTIAKGPNGEPECFYVKLNMCSYFKLVSDLTDAEKALLKSKSQ